MDTEIQDKENPHVMKVATSPSFLKPKAISLRKKVNRVKNTLPLSDVDLNKNDPYGGFLLKSPITARNPFRRNESKRKRYVENLDEDSNSLLWKQVNRTLDDSLAKMKNLPSPVVPSMLDESALSAFSDTVSSNLKSEVEKLPAMPQSKVLPVDWSLKVKVRFISSAPFPNKGSFRTFEEVNGTIGFVRCLHSGETDKSDVHSSHGAKVFQHCLVWMHPCLPWLNLFPRHDNHLGKQNSATLICPPMQEALHSKWCDSFRSLYQLVRLYQCPYFYMCTPTFTVLFRSAGAASIPVIHALISPTTKGFRKALHEEGITFTMPLCQSKDSDLSLEDTDEDLPNSAPIEDENKPLDIIEEDEPESWLESLGLSQDSLLSNKRKRRNDPAYQIDHKPESLVYVEDSETQALVNFLLNSHFCTSKIGPMAGVPPTLLAPTAFLGGTLQSLQIRHGKVKQGGEELHSMEMSGPLLPNAVHSMCSLFSSTQEGGFSAVLTSHTPTTPFSMVSPLSPMIPSIFAKNNMADCGLPQPFLQEMCSKTDNMPLNTITLDKGLFTWN